MNKKSEQQNDLKNLLEELRKQLLEASIHFDIWESLWPTEQAVDVINRFKGFFLPTRNAHIDRFYIKVCNIVSSKSSQPSFYRVFRILSKDENLVYGLDVRLLKKRINTYKKTLDAIEQHRNKRSAHWDTDVSAQRKPILFGDCKRMLKELQDIFNEISRAVTKNVWSFKPIQHGDTSILMSELKSGVKGRKPRPTSR